MKDEIDDVKTGKETTSPRYLPNVDTYMVGTVTRVAITLAMTEKRSLESN